MYRASTQCLLLATVPKLALLYTGFFHALALMPVQSVNANPMPKALGTKISPDLAKRSDSPTDVCFRWAQQSAIVNGTLYLYGGEATTQASQASNTWNNDFLTLDLTKTWQIANPSLSGLPQPSGPPPVALGYLWNSYESLYLYGGEFSDSPAQSPDAFSLWEYQIDEQRWVEHDNPTTSSGENAPSDGDAVQRAAEGAGVSVPSLGRGFYFGGHQDAYTTQGWSIQVPRIYLQSLLEFTFPGYTNDQVSALDDEQKAGTEGTYRNITEGGLQDSAGFTERADGVLVYVPAFGDQGILLALAGGTNDTFTQMNNIDVYDIARSTWYKQSTSGPTPEIRVNPCAVIAAAPDGSSYNIYMFGGQRLQPYGSQEQYDDMWILTLPSFTWIEVDMSGQSVPYGRSGHSCNIWDGQIIMVGGYVGDQLSCESPGIYVFDLSNCQWVQEFTALSPGKDGSSSPSAGSGTTGDEDEDTTNAKSTFNSTGSNNPLNQQPAQLANGTDTGGLEGSYGYRVPQIIIDKIGGNESGGATVTTPVVTATDGPLATGSATTYTLTNDPTSTSQPNSSDNNDNNPNDGSKDNDDHDPNNNNNKTSSDSRGNNPNIPAIVVGTICGLLFLLALYLAFCAYIYRAQLGLYRRHVEMMNRRQQQNGSEEDDDEKLSAAGLPGAGLLMAASADGRSGCSSGKNSSERSSKNGRRGVAWNGGGGGGGASHEGYQNGNLPPSMTIANTNHGMSAAAGGGGGGGGGSERSSTEDLLAGREPTFVGVLLNPRRSLKVVNRD
ncbi:kelch repeat protein [Hortaea werneckii]|uniref:Kelch repeat-containing protein n=1 Tax=Hortaea werneckii TaxID=91943 RepID=A0A3M7H5F5_HORWE|nr:kelch repeat protein [Hortaea werneckii]KAI6867529.1 kelch repeat protein [Hortaea werneckii]KAI7215214.1 kelch repeat protein [Hortaea werneckii]KAI7349712.1 kelch repeat protein [Hortaea werneckii]KAI7562959.1 kelch repeat protein [Hortaea werneckii]